MTTTWLTSADTELLEELWSDVPMNDELTDIYLDAAKEACLAYAPALAAGADVPASWRLAQVMQARNISNAGAAGTSGENDGSSYGLTTFPLDWQVKQLLRPRRGRGAIV